MEKLAIPSLKLDNKWRRRAAWAAGGIAVLWGVGWLAVPPLVKGQAETLASEKLGRKVTIGAVDFRPWSLELTVSDLTVAAADGQAAQLTVKRLYADAELQSLLRLAPVVDAVTVDEPVLRLTHLGDGRYDIDDVLQRLNKPSDPPAAEPARFALYNLALNGGALDFTDQTVNRTHAVRDLKLAVPFLSNLESKRDVKVAPHLAFQLNGSHFDSAAESTPFAPSHKTDATLKLTGFDLTPYLGYIPASLPVKLQAAVLDADLKLAFAQDPKPGVKLAGTIGVRGLKLADARQQDLLAFDALRVTLDDVRPLEQTVRLGEVALSAPRLSVRRDKGGRLNLALAAPKPATPLPKAPPATASGAAPAVPAWQVAVSKLTLRDGLVDWTDDTTALGKTPAARIQLQNLALDASAIALPFAQPLAFSGSAALAPATVTPAPSGQLSFSGTATDQAAQVTATIGALSLGVAAPYVAQYLEPTLAGTLDAALGLNWRAATGKDKPAALKLSIDRLALDRLALAQGRTVLASIKNLQLTDARLDPGAQSVALGKLTVTDPRLKIERDTDGRWMFDKWRKGAGTPPPADTRAAAQSTAPWKLGIADLLLVGGNLGWLDQATARPVAFEVSALRVQLSGFELDGRKPAPLQLSARIGAGRTEPGRLSYRGQLAMAPQLSTQGTVEALHVPVHAFEPYFADALNIELLRADTSFKGQVRYADSAAGPRVRVTGDTAVEDFRANSVQGSPTATAPVAPGAASAAGPAGLQLGEELLSWKALSLRGVDVSLEPGTATTVDVKETALSDFFARIIVHETGRINLQDLVKSQPPASGPTTPAVNAAATSTPAGPAPVINVGPVSLVNGKVHFSDRFIRPNYSANLTELTGKLSAFSSVAPGDAPQLADLELRGRAEGTASLEILGQVNPLAKPLALDIKGTVRELELPPLSPYSVKYAGHGIERGKLSMDVAYRVQPDGQLTASNKLVLNQLAFGDKVEGATASLPVKLAVALLADRNGVIDINLPISGSLNDPQFRLGPIIFKVIVNLVVKAITSPFSLLASAFGGGGDELSMVAFAPGSALLTADARQNLDKVTKALADRPALKMTVVGTANLAAERTGYQRERLNALVQAEKRRALLVGGSAPASADAANGAMLKVSDAEYPELLKAVYRRADMPKPRNLIGMAKDIPQAEMEALLLANIPVSEDAMRELALQRGVAVKDYLVTRQLPVERLFLGAAKAVAPDAKWSPRAELNLSTQ